MADFHGEIDEIGGVPPQKNPENSPRYQIFEDVFPNHSPGKIVISHMLHGAGIFTNICPCPKSPSFVGEHTIHGAYGYWVGGMVNASGQHGYHGEHDDETFLTHYTIYIRPIYNR